MSDATMLAELLDRQAVIDACSRYAAAVDRTARELSDESFDDYATTMTEDCVVDYGPLGRFESRDEWIAFARGLAERGGRCHHLYANFFIDLDGDEARARFHAQAMHFWPDEPVEHQLLVATALFDNLLRRTPDGWKLCRVQPNVQFAHDPGAAITRMFPVAS